MTSTRTSSRMAVLTPVVLVCFAQAAPLPAQSDLAERAEAVLAQHHGTIVSQGLSDPVEVLRDYWGIPHIYANNTADLFFAQGFVAAQDRMWQMEMWRRKGEGKLSEVLGADYVTGDHFARLLAFRGDWNDEYRKYHPEGKLIFDSFAAGVNAAIQHAIDAGKVPIEFDIMGFRPQPVWTAKTILTRIPGWTLSRNASSEVNRALLIRELGLEAVQALQPSRPGKQLEIPAGLDLDDIEEGILDLTRGASSLRWSFEPRTGSNNWVIDGSMSATGMPLLANDPHREVVNPALRHLVHLVSPEWNVFGGTEPGLPGVTIGHNEHVAWGFTILGVDQQDIYVETLHPADDHRYLYRGEWLDMEIERQLLPVRGQRDPVEVTLKFTRHGPVLHENTSRRRAFSLRWVGSEPGGAGFPGTLNVLQAESFEEFRAGLAKAWYLPSHSLVYADVEGNIGYFAAALTPVRRNWDGLLPVPAHKGKYEWEGFLPYEELPNEKNTRRGFYNTSNNDVVPEILPDYAIPLGYEYSAPYRYDRVFEVLSQYRRFTVRDMERLQQDVVSLPAREVVPMLGGIRTDDPATRQALEILRSWDFAMDQGSTAAVIYEFLQLNLPRHAYAPRLKAFQAEGVWRQFDLENAIQWLKAPDQYYGSDRETRMATRDRILLAALQEALEDLRRLLGPDMERWMWGDLHTADFVHPLATTDEVPSPFHIDPVPRGGDGFTVMNTTSASATNTSQLFGASFMFVFDVEDWDRSTGLSAPGNSAQPGSPHYQDLVQNWAQGDYFPLAFSRGKVEEVTKSRLVLCPPVPAISTVGAPDEPRFVESRRCGR